MKKTNLKVGEAIEAIVQGERLRRSSWPKERKFIFQQVPSDIPSAVIPKMQSLPQKVKDFFESTFKDESEQIDSIYYTDQIAEVGLSNLITAFSASISDLLAEDWEILD